MRPARARGETACMASREPKLIINVTRGSVVCERGVIADGPLARMRGLLGRTRLPTGEGLLLRPAPSIHTAFMRFPIDAVFLDSSLRIIKLVERLPPWRTAAARRAKAVLELPAGESGRRGLKVADRLAIVDQIASRAPEQSSQTRVLLVASDRRFRTVASVLLTRRGYRVTAHERVADLVALAAREGAEVVVVDATPSLTEVARERARLQALRPPVGIVVVSDEST